MLLDLPSLCAICSVLFNTFMKLSASPLARGCSWVTLWCLYPISSANSLMSLELKGGPLSLSIICGMPCIANIARSLSQVTLLDVDVVCSTSGNQVLLSITTRLK